MNDPNRTLAARLPSLEGSLRRTRLAVAAIILPLAWTFAACCCAPKTVEAERILLPPGAAERPERSLVSLNRRVAGMHVRAQGGRRGVPRWRVRAHCRGGKVRGRLTGALVALLGGGTSGSRRVPRSPCLHDVSGPAAGGPRGARERGSHPGGVRVARA